MAGLSEASLREAPVRSGMHRAEGAAERAVSILVDARGIYASGIGRYVREILSALFADPRFSRVRLLGDPEALREYCGTVGGGERAEVFPYSYGFYTPQAQAGWLRLRAGGRTRADVAFFPHYDVPLLGFPGRSVVTVHDLIHFKVPELFSPWRRAGGGVLLRRGVTGARRIITVSDATRRDLVARFPRAAPRVEVVPNGVSTVFRSGPGAAEARPPRPVAGPYLLCVGNRKPHKNLAAAVEALALLAPEMPHLRLVIAGEVYRGWEAVGTRAEALGVRDRIVEVDGATDAELRELYAHSEALLFPSLYEGFGLPVLEAMACGAPVVASNRSSIPEVAGDAGLLVDPERPEEMRDAVLRLHREPGLRETLVERGRRRAAAFTWECAARTTADLLYGVATAGRRQNGGPGDREG